MKIENKREVELFSEKWNKNILLNVRRVDPVKN